MRLASKEVSFLGIKFELESEDPPEDVVEFLDGSRQEPVQVFDAKLTKAPKVNNS